LRARDVGQQQEAQSTWRQIPVELVTETDPKQFQLLPKELVNAVEKYKPDAASSQWEAAEEMARCNHVLHTIALLRSKVRQTFTCREGAFPLVGGRSPLDGPQGVNYQSHHCENDQVHHHFAPPDKELRIAQCYGSWI